MSDCDINSQIGEISSIETGVEGDLVNIKYSCLLLERIEIKEEPFKRPEATAILRDGSRIPIYFSDGNMITFLDKGNTSKD